MGYFFLALYQNCVWFDNDFVTEFNWYLADMDTNETLFEVDVPCPENMTFPQLADVCIAAGSDDCRWEVFSYW